MSTAQDLPLRDGAVRPAEPLPSRAPRLRLVPAEPLDFDDAVTRLRPRLHRFAIRRLGDVHEAEELVQEALLRAYTHREQLLTEDDLSAWTTVVTGRLVIDRLRVRGRSTSVADVPEGRRVGRDTADIVIAKDEARTALDALDAMPVRQAALLWAREVEGHSYDELCVRFQMTEPAVRSILTRARKALRKEYALRGGTLPVGGLAVLAPWVLGLTRADKLRRLASRATAPAALGAVAITTLGGLILSPFGIGATGPDGTYSPSQAVVSGNAQPTTATGTTRSAATATQPAPRTATRPVTVTRTATAQAAPPLSVVVTSTCANGQVAGSAVGAGGPSCDPAAGPHNTVFSFKLPTPLPANPLGVNQQITVLSTVPCSQVPTNPVTQCTATSGDSQ